MQAIQQFAFCTKSINHLHKIQSKKNPLEITSDRTFPTTQLQRWRQSSEQGPEAGVEPATFQICRRRSVDGEMTALSIEPPWLAFGMKTIAAIELDIWQG